MACRHWLRLAVLLCIAVAVLAASFKGEDESVRAANARASGGSSPRLKNTAASPTKGKAAAAKGTTTKRMTATTGASQGTTRAPTTTTGRATTAKLKTNSPTRAPMASTVAAATTAAPTATTKARLKSTVSLPTAQDEAVRSGKAAQGGEQAVAEPQPKLEAQPKQGKSEERQGTTPSIGKMQEQPQEQAQEAPLNQGGEADTKVLGDRLTEKEKRDGVARHNWYRCKVRPWAELMPALVWDDKLAEVAQRYADSCPTGHNANRSLWYKELLGSDKNIYVGESIGYGFPTLAHATDDFASKAQHFLHTENSCQPGHSCGPYTQVVWAGSTRLGCARPTGPCPGRHGTSIYVCNYATGGNVRGKRPYESTGNCIQTDACAAINSTNGCDASCGGLAAGTVCRAADPNNSCAAPSVCDGIHNACPTLTPKPDGTPCSLQGEEGGDGVAGMCFEGKCDPVHENVYKADFAAPPAGCTDGDCGGAAGCAPGQSAPAKDEPARETKP